MQSFGTSYREPAALRALTFDFERGTKTNHHDREGEVADDVEWVKQP